MSQNENSAAMSRAWKLSGNEAIDAFQQIVKGSPADLDALYGLGMAQKRAGLTADARASFTQLKALVAAELAAHPAEDRFQMLTRIVDQRLSELASVAR